MDAAARLDEDALIAATPQLQKTRKASSKRTITRKGPLKDRQKGRRPSTEAEQDREARAAILEAQAAADKLPSNSAYARHRRACLSKALQLLDLCRRA